MELFEEDQFGVQGNNGFSWESRYVHTWDVLKEDLDGTLESSVQSIRAAKYIQHRRTLADKVLKRGILRNLCVILDGSKSSLEQDYLPTRGKNMLMHLVEFAKSFFDQNPISQMGLVTMIDGLAERQIGFTGNFKDFLAKTPSDFEGSGEASILNALDLARSMLSHVPGHGTKEIVILFCGVSSSDMGDVIHTIELLKRMKTKVSCVCLSGEIFVLRKVCLETGGKFFVPLNDDHAKDILKGFVIPPEISALERSTLSYLVPMGFPNRVSSASGVCSCHARISEEQSLISCPRCMSLVCQVPSDCPVCGLTLVTGPHLAKTYHHLFPMSSRQQSNSTDATCFACDAVVTKAVVCHGCSHSFCEMCDTFTHDELFTCPGCIS